VSASPPSEIAALAALAAAPAGLSARELDAHLGRADIAPAAAAEARRRLLANGHARERGGVLALSGAGAAELLRVVAEIEAALDPSPWPAGMDECPSIPFLTTVQTCWVEAVSINYAVDPQALAGLLPAPLEPEIHRGTGWVQVLMSSLRDMRPQGVLSLFGVCFYQVSYRAAVRYRSLGGGWHRGGYFVRSQTNHEVMRAVGNALREFKFHDFGAAEMTMLRAGDRLTVGVEPDLPGQDGKLLGIFDTRPLPEPPRGSVWSSVDELHTPLVECYDAFGVDADQGYIYVLTIDRAPWDPQFVTPEQLYCEYFDSGPLGRGAARFDSVLHVPRECPYRWRPLRRERFGN